LNYGSGTGLNNKQSAGGSLYTHYTNSTTPGVFDGNGSVRQIQIYNNTTNGRLRIWKGTWSSQTFTFDSYTEVVDISSLSTGWITLNSPTDFTAFDVTSSTGLIFYSHDTNTVGLQFGRSSSGAAAWNQDDPPYSADKTFTYSSSGVLQVKIEGYAT